MKKYTECDIVRELLPLYIEQKTGEESNAYVAGHLPKCEECRAIHQWMSADWLEEKLAESNQELVNKNKPTRGMLKKKSKY